MSASYEYLTEKTCKNLNIKISDLIYSDYGYNCMIQFIHYYRMKDMYDTYIQNKKYNRKFIFNNYDYHRLFSNGFNYYEFSFQLHEMRNNKNKMLNIFVSNLQFYKMDKNIPMFLVSKNLIYILYKYASLFENKDKKKHISQIDENNCLNDIIYGFNLYYYMLNKETFLSENEMNNLLN